MASTAAVVIGVAMFWDVLNPLEWTADSWAAVGSWVASIGTVLAVGVALWQSHQARKDADRALQHEYWRADIGTSLHVLDTLRSLVRYMDQDASRAIVAYRSEWDAAQDAELGPPDEHSSFWYHHWNELISVHSAVQDYRAELETAGLSIRTPDLHKALDVALSTTKLIEDQLQKWKTVIQGEQQINEVLGGIDEIIKKQNLEDLDTVPERVLATCARYARQTMLDAAKSSQTVDPWRAQPGRE